MDYRDYKASRNLAWEILLREDVRKLPVRPSAMCRSMGISLAYGNQEQGSDGYSAVISGAMYIVIKRDKPASRIRFTIAHEIGHILLGHLGTCHLVNREPSGTDTPVEHEANVFASRLLAPACVLWGCGAQSAEEIAELCGISQQSARIRAERMAVLRKRNQFLVSPLERELYEKFLPFIREHRIR